MMMYDDFDQGGGMEPEQGFAPQVQPAQQLLPEPFSQADNLRLQRLQQGLSSAQEQVDTGVLAPEHGETLKQQILQQMGPLSQRKQQAKAQAMQEQQMMLMHQHAQQEAMGQQAAEFRAQGLSKRVAPFTDPFTGETTHLLETKPGHVEELKFERHHARAEMDAGGGALGEEDAAPAENPQSIDYNPLGGGAALSATPEEPSKPDDATFDKPAEKKPFTQEIWNGSQLTRHTYSEEGKHQKEETFSPDGRKIGQTTFQEDGTVDKQQGVRLDQRGQPIGEAQGNIQAGLDQGLVSPAQIDILKQRAMQSVGPAPKPPPDLNQLPPQAQIGFRQAQQNWQKQLGSTFNHLLTKHLDDEKDKRSVQRRSQEAQRKEADQADKVESQKKADATLKEKRTLFTKHLTDLHKQRHDFLTQKDAETKKPLHTEADLPEELQSDDSMQAKAGRMADAAFEYSTPKNQTKPGGPGAGPSANDQAPPAVPGASPGTQTPPTQAATPPNQTAPGGPGAVGFHPEAAKQRADLFNNDPHFKRALQNASMNRDDLQALMTVRDMIAQYGPPASIPPQKQILFRQAAFRAKKYMPSLSKYAPE